MLSKNAWLTIAICTRNRPQDLKKCIQSIASQSVAFKNAINVLIIDDGNLDSSTINEIKNNLFEYNFDYKKKGKPGLLLSRIFAISIVETEYILFLDDDVVIEKNYLNSLGKNVKEDLEVVGISGIDLLITKPNICKKIYHSLFLLKSRNAGKLSITGYGESMQYWQLQNQIFSTEFLSGCNMIFKKQALLDINSVEWLSSYSLGEDVYLSNIASKRGKLIINPALKVSHFQSKVSRDKIEIVSYNEIINHHFLLKLRNSSGWKIFLHGWTIFGIILKNAVSLNYRALKGYFRAVSDLLKRKI